jgi:hypothetical protein
MPLHLAAFPEFQALQLLCAQLSARVSYLEEQIPEWVDTVEARRLTNLSYSSLRRARSKSGSLIKYKNSRYERATLLAHNDSRTIPTRATSPVNKHPFTTLKRPMNQVIDLTLFIEFQELAQRCQQLLARVDEVERKLPEWVDKHEASRLTGVSTATLVRWRVKADSPIVWKDDYGTHYQRASLLAFNSLRARGRGVLARLLAGEL